MIGKWYIRREGAERGTRKGLSRERTFEHRSD